MVKKILGAALAAFLGIAFALAVTCAFSILKVPAETMAPAIKAESRVLVNKLAYLYGSPDEGDVVAFACSVYGEDGEGSILVRRVVATQGDIVEIREGYLYVNGELYDKHMKEPVYMNTLEKTTVGENNVFVLSDNRQAVLDSRDDAIGQLSTTQLMGKVCFK